MADRSFLSDVLSRVAGGDWRGRLNITAEPDLIAACQDLLADRDEAAGLKRAQHILDRYDALDSDQKTAFLTRLATEFGANDDAVADAIESWTAGDVNAARKLHFAAEPRSQALIRTLNRVPGATARLVSMRADLLKYAKGNSALRGLDEDFEHLLGSWFSRGFLEIRRINWSTPADILEKIIAYEAVHEIAGWDDLRKRVGDADRRLFAFFHPAMPSEPLIFVEVALTDRIPGAIAPILDPDRTLVDPAAATTAVFYSISNCQKGLRGISFGNFLIKQVVVELQNELPHLGRFVTLSPVPGLRRWVEQALKDGDGLLGESHRSVLSDVAAGASVVPPVFAAHLAALYLTQAKRPGGRAFDPVAHFHLGNGAVLHAVHPEADHSDRGRQNSCGVMVNYLYAGDQIETNQSAYATEHRIAAAKSVETLANDR